MNILIPNKYIHRHSKGLMKFRNSIELGKLEKMAFEISSSWYNLEIDFLKSIQHNGKFHRL